MARIAVVGVGAIGGALVAMLHGEGDHQITLCTRRPMHTLTVETPSGVVKVEARNLTSPADANETMDWVIVATKAYDAEATGEWLKKLCGNATLVAIVQNGVEHRERFAAFVPVERLVPVIIDCPVERRPDGTVWQRGAAQMFVEDVPSGRAFVDLFPPSAVTFDLTGDFTTAAWRKLSLNSAGILSALLLKPSRVFHEEGIAEIALQLITECVAVGNVAGARLPEDLPAVVMQKTLAQIPDSVNSMLADRLAGRPMEIDARNGVIVRLGERYGIPTPANRMAAALLRAMVK